MSDDSYSELLKHPRWQKRRLEALEKSDFACDICAATETELHVHHEYYVRGRKPWQYPLRTLRSLCKHCHDSTHEKSYTPVYDAGYRDLFFDETEQEEKAAFAHQKTGKLAELMKHARERIIYAGIAPMVDAVFLVNGEHTHKTPGEKDHAFGFVVILDEMAWFECGTKEAIDNAISLFEQTYETSRQRAA